MSLHNQYTNSCTTQYINLCANQYNILINECGRDYTFLINEHLDSTNNIFINNDNNLKIKDKLLEIEAIKLFKHLQTS
jgi:hypothetical protein